MGKSTFFIPTVLLAFLISAALVIGGCSTAMRSGSEVNPSEHFEVHPIGKIQREGGRTFVVLDKEYEPGLLGLEKHAYVTVVYWFDKNDTPDKRAILQVHPRANRDNPLTGVFATHAPFRPNLIAISKCDIVSVHENIIEVKEIDAFDNTPVLDLKGDFFRFHK